MSDSYSVTPISSEARAWLASEGHSVPSQDGRSVSLVELKAVIATIPDVQAEWQAGGQFLDGHLKSIGGNETTIIIGEPGEAGHPCAFHFRGGEPEFIVQVIRAIASLAGPQLVYAHSGEFTKVVG